MRFTFDLVASFAIPALGAEGAVALSFLLPLSYLERRLGVTPGISERLLSVSESFIV